MIPLLKRLGRSLARFRQDEAGSGTLEFVMVIPGFMLLFTSPYEAGVMSTRHVVLESALDKTVRDVRIGRIPSPTNENLSERICEYASIIPSCLTNLRLNMQRVDPRAWNGSGLGTDCVDKNEPNQPAVVFANTGGNNDLMVLIACSLFDPMIPTTGLGKQLVSDNGGTYALVATSSYVMEPFQ